MQGTLRLFASPLCPLLALPFSALVPLQAAPWWEEALVFGESPLPATFSGETKVHAWGGTAETPADVQALAAAVQAAHSEGTKFVGTISAFNPSHGAIEVFPELQQARVVDIDEAFSTIKWKSNSEVTTYFYNTNESIYQDFLKQQVENLIDAGVDAILIDEIEGAAGTINRGGSFGPRDMAMFNDYLLEQYTAEQLEDFWGIEIENFNYGNWIRERGSAEAYRENPFSIPLFEAYRDFQRSAVRDFMEELVAHGKAYAENEYDKEIAFTANIYGWASHQILFGDLLDYFTVEYGYREDGYAPENHALPYMLYANSRGKRSFLLPGVYTGNQIHAWATRDIGALWLMESYVTGNGFFHGRELFGGTSRIDGRFLEFNLNYDGNTRLIEFVREHPFAFSGEPHRRVGVLYSYPSDYVNYIRDRWGGVAFALLDAQVQFDVLSLGDDIFMEDTFVDEDLSGYNTLVLPWAKNMTRAQTDRLLAWVDGGGELIIIGEDTGSRQVRNEHFDRPEWNGATQLGSQEYGEGEIHVLPFGWGLDYFETRDPQQRPELIQYLGDLPTALTASDAPSTLHLRARQAASEPLLMIHALNYDFDTETQVITLSPAVTVEVSLPSELADAEDLQAYQLTPGQSVRLPVTRGAEAGRATVEVDPVNVYAAIVLTSAEHAQALTDETLTAVNTFLDDRGVRDRDRTQQALAEIDMAYAQDDFFAARSQALALQREWVLSLRPRVLFSESNQELMFVNEERAAETNPENPDAASLSDVAAILREEFIVDTTTEMLTDGLLTNYDVLVLNAPWKWFEDHEVDAIHDFVDRGGGLLVLGNPFLNSALSPITLPYGIFVHGEVLSRKSADTFGVFRPELAINHPSVDPQQPFRLNWPTRLTVEAPAVTVLESGEDAWLDEVTIDYERGYGETEGNFALAAIHEAEDRRVFVLGDTPFHNSFLSVTRNDQLLRSALHWLADGPPTARPHGPAREAYWAWVDEFFADAEREANPEGQAWLPTSDPDGDGLNNLLEMLTGTDPLSTSVSPLRWVAASDKDSPAKPQVTVEVPESTDGLDDLIFSQRSVDLRNWRWVRPEAVEWDEATGVLRISFPPTKDGEIGFFRLTAAFDDPN
ncbi:MAG: hypothetical protein ACFB21_11735 [Opitutales bacterium]